MKKSGPKSYNAWTRSELQKLTTLVEEGRGNKEISVILDRTYSSVTSKIAYLMETEGLKRGGKFKSFGRKNLPWTPEEDDKLLDMILAGATTSQIALTLGRSRSAIWARKSNHKLNDVRIKRSNKGTTVPASLNHRSPRNDEQVNPSSPSTQGSLFKEEVSPQDVMIVDSQGNEGSSDISNIEKIIQLAKESGLKVTITIS